MSSKKYFFLKNLSLQSVVSIAITLGASLGLASVEPQILPEAKKLNSFQFQDFELAGERDSAIIFDLPVTYNQHVQKWIRHFQGPGRKWFRTWLERSHRYTPSIKRVMRQKNLPLDLAFVAMIESGFSAQAVSSAQAVGPWQFIQATGNRYGLKTTWWLDERRDFEKSTLAAASYLADLYKIFNSWYLVVAGYNMGESGVMRLIKRHGTTDYWSLVKKGAFSDETKNYVPKLIAAMLISKAPHLYGFHGVQQIEPLDYEYFSVPGGTDLRKLADHMGIQRKELAELNRELMLQLVPNGIPSHLIRIPKNSVKKASHYLRTQLAQNANR